MKLVPLRKEVAKPLMIMGCFLLWQERSHSLQSWEALKKMIKDLRGALKYFNTSKYDAAVKQETSARKWCDRERERERENRIKHKWQQDVSFLRKRWLEQELQRSHQKKHVQKDFTRSPLLVVRTVLLGQSNRGKANNTQVWGTIALEGR